jgi:hypothetical protein
LLIGSIGRLYGRTVITTRLVDMTNYQILFANSIYAENDKIDTDIHTLANAIGDKSQEMNLKPSLEDIQKQIKARNFIEAKKLLDIYIRNTSDNEGTRNLYPLVIAGLADQYYRNARSLLSRRLFDDARAKLNQALALRVDERYYSLREKINIDEEDWLFRQKIDEARRREQLERQAAGGSAMTGLAGWYDALKPNGAFVAAAMQLPVDQTEFRPDMADASFGGELSWLTPVKKQQGPYDTLTWSAYVGSSLNLRKLDSGSILEVSVYASPALAQTLRLGNIFITTGLDAGGFFRIGTLGADQAFAVIPGVTAGARVLATMKLWNRLGVFAAAKADFVHVPGGELVQAILLRLSAGLSF